MPTSAPTSQKPQTKKDKQKRAQNIVRQILNEPLEIARTAGKQIVGGEPASPDASRGGWQEQTIVQKPQTGEQPAFGNQDEAVKKQKRDSRHYQAFQTELAEIRRIQKQRAQDLEQLRAQEAQQKQAKEQQAQKQNTLIEPITKKARGMLGGVNIGLKRKQTQVEIQKTPSN